MPILDFAPNFAASIPPNLVHKASPEIMAEFNIIRPSLATTALRVALSALLPVWEAVASSVPSSLVRPASTPAFLGSFPPIAGSFQPFSALAANKPDFAKAVKWDKWNQLMPYAQEIVSKQVYEEFASFSQAYHHVLSKLSVSILQDLRLIVVANTTSLSLLLTSPNTHARLQVVPLSGFIPKSSPILVLFIEDLLKLHNRAKVNKITAERIAGEKHRAEKEDALMEVQATKKVKKNKKGKAPKEDADDGESVIADVDTHMDDVSTSQDSNDADIQSIDGKAFMAEINDQEERRTTVKTKASGKASKASKGKAGRAETSNAYAKAMKIVKKTNPTEAAQVAAEPNSVRRKHRRANSFVEADPDSQGVQTCSRWPGHLSNEALICQEYENRSEYNVTVHRLEHHLTIAKLLYAEQERLVALMQECKVSPVAELPLVYDEGLLQHWLLSDEDIDALPSPTTSEYEEVFSTLQCYGLVPQGIPSPAVVADYAMSP
ncbi:hypothetical protein DFH08DRAFT_823439 [Mycena albidolilacea]|uniref:Uncharacterized protein n=1 Tax=Mycena albidolilacea TaxID=1033008 RepID=A0AAD7EC73_9AGAR|nr:hypothetical protein DFH08DRAFT_823439 [Mycena albidolilacea]